MVSLANQHKKKETDAWSLKREVSSRTIVCGGRVQQNKKQRNFSPFSRKIRVCMCMHVNTRWAKEERQPAARNLSRENERRKEANKPSAVRNLSRKKETKARKDYDAAILVVRGERQVMFRGVVSCVEEQAGTRQGFVVMPCTMRLLGGRQFMGGNVS